MKINEKEGEDGPFFFKKVWLDVGIVIPQKVTLVEPMYSVFARVRRLGYF